MTLDLSLLPDGGVRWLDASGQHSDVVLSTRVRLARNVDGYAFASRARDGERLRVLAQVREALGHVPGMPESFLVRVDELRAQDWLSRRARARRTSVAGSDPRAVIGFEDLPEQGQELEGADAPDPDELVDAHRSWQSVHAAIALLPARERRLVEMHYLQGLPLKDVAAELGVSEPRVSQLHARAITMLRSKCLRAA